MTKRHLQHDKESEVNGQTKILQERLAHLETVLDQSRLRREELERERDNLRAQLAEAQAERDKARGALAWIAQEFWSGCDEVDSLEWQEEMERRGLLVKTDPTEDHIAEWGDDADMYTLKWLANAGEESDDAI